MILFMWGIIFVALTIPIEPGRIVAGAVARLREGRREDSIQGQSAPI
jgi:hypothetical protein